MPGHAHAPDAIWCPACRRLLRARGWDQHEASDRHKVSLASVRVDRTDANNGAVHPSIYCEPCGVYLSKASGPSALAHFRQHVTGDRHLKMSREFVPAAAAAAAGRASTHTAGPSRGSSRSQPAPPSGGAFACELCGITATCQANLDAHLSGRWHAVKKALADLKQEPELFAAVSKGIAIAPCPATGAAIRLGQIEEGSAEPLKERIVITNHGHEPRFLTAAVVLPPDAPFAVNYQTGRTVSGNTIKIPAGMQFVLELSGLSRGSGEAAAVVLFRFDRCILARRLAMTVVPRGRAEDFALVQPTAPFVRPPRRAAPAATEIVPGEPLPSDGGSRARRPLDLYRIPGWMLHTPDAEFVAHVERARARPDHTVLRELAFLLHVEEIRMNADIRAYDRRAATLQPVGAGLQLDEPGLAEKRPSVLRGDRVYVALHDPRRPPEQAPGREYEGVVHSVQETTLTLRFAPSFHREYVRGRLVDVRFTFSRTPLRRMHRALACVEREFPDLLTPPPPSAFAALRLPAEPITPSTLDPMRRDLNAEQAAAVCGILNASSGRYPYLVHGPPGTGKTTVLLEAACQVLRRRPDARLLLCAPSNSAADLLAGRLMAVLDSTRLFRLNAYQRAPASVDPADLLNRGYCHAAAGGFGVPPLERLAAFRAVCSTCVSAALLADAGLKAGHFDLILVDEAAQATAPEVMVALDGLYLHGTTRLVLAGDHKQLGPVIRSPAARRLGLDASALERLASSEAFRVGPETHFSGPLITRLLRNYRSHPAIVAIPSRLFYDDSLQPVADRVKTDRVLGWEELPNPKFPLLFCGVEGKDEREGSSPSFFNTLECVEVARLVASLVHSRKARPDMIGVISPYQRQVRKLRRLLAARGFASEEARERTARAAGVRVGTVEEFQGQERPVIIVSTVRSNAGSDWTGFDAKFNLGFVNHPKRFNVAITRPEACLVVVGNPRVLLQDRGWRALLEYIRANGNAKGVPFPPEDDELAARMAELVIGPLRPGQEAGGEGGGPEAPDPEEQQWTDHR